MYKELKIGDKLRIIAGGVEGGRFHNFKHGSEVTVANGSRGDYVSTRGVVFYADGRVEQNGAQMIRREHFKEIGAVNFSVPLFTAEGTPVEIITTAGRDKKYPVLAYEGKAKLPSKFTLEGISKSGEARRNLMNVQAVEEPTEAKEEAVNEVVLYANLYDDDRGLRQLDLGSELYESVDAATESYKEGRIESKKHPKRIGVAKVTLVKGKLPSRFNKEGK